MYYTLDGNKIIIGNNTLTTSNVQIFTSFHPTNVPESFGDSKEDGSFVFFNTQLQDCKVDERRVVDSI